MEKKNATLYCYWKLFTKNCDCLSSGVATQKSDRMTMCDITIRVCLFLCVCVSV